MYMDIIIISFEGYSGENSTGEWELTAIYIMSNKEYINIHVY